MNAARVLFQISVGSRETGLTLAFEFKNSVVLSQGGSPNVRPWQWAPPHALPPARDVISCSGLLTHSCIYTRHSIAVRLASEHVKHVSRFLPIDLATCVHSARISEPCREQKVNEGPVLLLGSTV